MKGVLPLIIGGGIGFIIGMTFKYKDVIFTLDNFMILNYVVLIITGFASLRIIYKTITSTVNKILHNQARIINILESRDY